MGSSVKILKRNRVKKGTRHHYKGSDKIRLVVFRSNSEIYAQLVDDQNSKTLASASSLLKEIADLKLNKTEQSKKVGELIAKKATEAGISEVAFDRNGFKYHGRIKALADAAREGGLKF